jgi:prophage maintenance system killer protein
MDVSAWRQKLHISPLSLITWGGFVLVFVTFGGYTFLLNQKEISLQMLRSEIKYLRKENQQLTNLTQELEQYILSFQTETGDVQINTSEPAASEIEIEQAQDRSFVYEVKKGDTIWDIAAMYNVTIEDILRWNNLTKRSRIFPGDQLTIILE